MQSFGIWLCFTHVAWAQATPKIWVKPRSPERKARMLWPRPQLELQGGGRGGLPGTREQAQPQLWNLHPTRSGKAQASGGSARVGAITRELLCFCSLPFSRAMVAAWWESPKVGPRPQHPHSGQTRRLVCMDCFLPLLPGDCLIQREWHWGPEPSLCPQSRSTRGGRFHAGVFGENDKH